MPKRQYKTDPGQLLAQGQLLVKATKDNKFQHRVEMVNLVLAGLPPSILSKFSGESKNTITRWVKTVDEEGFEALHPKKQSGRPPLLVEDKLKELKGILKEDNPKKYGYNVWEGKTLSAFIAKRFGIKLSVRQCQRLLHLLGFSLIRPQQVPHKAKQDKQARAAFKKNSRN